MTRFTYSQVYSLETDFTEPCSEHALIRGGVGKMGGELLLAFLGLLALVHGEIVGYVDVQNTKCLLAIDDIVLSVGHSEIVG